MNLTSIDDLKKQIKINKKHKEQLMQLIPILLGVLIGVVVSRLSLIQTALETLSFGQWLFLVIGILLVFYGHILFHEVGHLVVGCVGKFNFYSFKLGPLLWEKEKGKLTFKVEKYNGHTGMCVMLPSNDRDLHIKLLIYYLGGIGVNLLLMIIFLIALAFTSQENLLLRTFLSIGWVIGAFVFGVNALPYKSKGFKTDGANLLSLVRKSPKDLAEISVMYTSIQLNSGIRPGALYEAMLKENKNLDHSEMLGITMNIYRFYHYLDKGSHKKALQAIKRIEKYIAYYPVGFRWELLYNVFYSYCFLNYDLDKAQNYYRRIKRRIYNDPTITRYRVQMAYEWYINKDKEKAINLGQLGLKLKAICPVKGESIFEVDQITRMLNEIESA